RLKNALKKYSPALIKVPDTEKSKSNLQVVRVIESIVKIDKGRGIFIISLGGGVVGDLSGFVASIYKRGVPYIQIPTTLLAQVDSAIGGKVAIDLTSAKNLVGAFYQPRLVVSDISMLRSLPARQIRSGLGEIIKYGIIKDLKLFSYLEENIYRIKRLNKDALEYIITRSSAIKAQVVHLDEYDNRGIRASLNFGHTIGHALETACGYSKLYSHGEAVALGMVAASRIAVQLGLLEDISLKRIIKLLKEAGLPTEISSRLKTEKIMKAQTHDKKIIRGVNRFVLPVKIGRTRIYEDIPRRLIVDTIKLMRKG
ncbi:MAG: 3-dehydroquinate synthase, partial [Candidatus Omnitrophota bacterium]